MVDENIARSNRNGRANAAVPVPLQSFVPIILMTGFVLLQVAIYSDWIGIRWFGYGKDDTRGASSIPDDDDDDATESTRISAADLKFSEQILLTEERTNSLDLDFSDYDEFKEDPIAQASVFLGGAVKESEKEDEPSHSTTQKRGKKYSKIDQISVLGERNSGTRWTVSHLSKCFNHTLIVQEKLVRHKHWFQHDVDNGKERVGTLVVAQFREPYQWIAAMILRPHHSPAHCCKMPWKRFVTSVWNIERPESDIAIRDGNATLGIPSSEIQCQEYFNYNQINSCQLRPYPPGHFAKKPSMSGHQPQYEMRNDGSGLPYNNILELRSDKIKNHLSVAQWQWVTEFMSVQYEDLLERGTKFLIKNIEKATGVKAKCVPFEPQPKRKKHRVTRGLRRWITDHLDWKTEALVGYTPQK